MTPRQIIDLWRRRYGDEAAAYWSDEELLAYVGEAQTEAALRIAFIIDQSSEVAVHTVFAGDPLIERPPAILRVRNARLLSDKRPLVLRQDALENPAPDWETHTGTPLALIVRFDDDYARLYPTPVADDTLVTFVHRLPVEPVELDLELEIRPQWHRHLEDWVTYRALMKPGDRRDPSRALEAKVLFEDGFGPVKDWNG